MSNRDILIAHRNTLQGVVASLREIEAPLPSANAETWVRRAHEMIHAAEGMLSRALSTRLEGFSDALDLPAHPQGRWGAELRHEGGGKPDWIAPDDWVGDDGYSSPAYQRAWYKPFCFRLRADHPHYQTAEAAQ